MLPTPENFPQNADAASDQVDAWLLDFLRVPSPVPNLHDGAAYSMGLDVPDRRTRGKRIRPVLCLLTAEALGADPQRALPFAAAIELLHNFALVHDDIEDGDTMRRGRPAVWQRYGLPHGINIGDYLFALVFRALLRDRLNPPAVQDVLRGILDETLEDLFAGQALDMNARATHHFTAAEYNRVVALKTGSYLAAPLLGGAVVAGAGDDVLAALRRAGRALGPLFQIKDDVIDLSTGKGRDSVGSDIREGKRSFLVAVVAERCAAADRERLFSILDAPRAATSDADVQWTIDLFARHGALHEAERRCVELRQEALAALEGLPPALRHTLTIVTDHLTTRTA